MLSDSKKTFLALFFLLAVNIFIYWPSLSYWPRSDAWAYFINTAGIDDFFRLVRDFYSYDRVVDIEPGHSLLFRPLLFSLLAFQKSFFGLNFFLWQGLSLFLHLVFITLLFFTIRRIAKSLAVATISPLVISLLPGAQEMVFWPQISGYLLFLTTQIIAVNIVYDSLVGGKPSCRKAVVLAVVMFISACFHEFGGILLVVMFSVIILFRQNLKKSLPTYLLSLALAGVLYFSWYIFDYMANIEHIQAVESCVVGGWQGGTAFPVKMITALPIAVLRAFAAWTMIPLFPVLCEYFSSFRIFMDIWPSRIFSWQFLVNLSGMLVIFWYVGCSFSLKIVRKNMPLVIFYLLALFLFAAMVCLGRGSFGEIYIFLFNGYYYYLFWAFFLPFMVFICDWEKVYSSRRIFVFIALTCVIGYLSFCAYIVYGLNTNYARMAARHSWYLADIRTFISLHKQEKDFSFSLKEREKLAAFTFPVLEKKDHKYTLIERKFDPVYALFSRYIDDAKPKYIARYDPVIGLIWEVSGYRVDDVKK